MEKVYSAHSQVKHNKFFGEGNKFIGFELEVDHTNYEQEHIATKIGDVFNFENGERNQRLFFERDGSLGYGGFEIISAPHSLKELRKLDFETLANICKSFGLKGNKSNNAGLHFHFSRTWFKDDEHVARVALVIEKFYSNAMEIGRRNSDTIRWCMKHETKGVDSMLSQLRRGEKYRHTNGRYLRNNTIEFRMFKSTLDKDVFRASYELIVALIRATEKDNIKSFDDIVGANLMQYLEHRKHYYSFLKKGVDKALNSKIVKKISEEVKEIKTLEEFNNIPQGTRFKAVVKQDIHSIERELEKISYKLRVGIGIHMPDMEGREFYFIKKYENTRCYNEDCEDSRYQIYTWSFPYLENITVMGAEIIDESNVVD